MRRCGTIALVGRPNVGKSTLLNTLLGEDLAIVSPKSQTTRHRVVGVRSEGELQCIFVDTPGQADTHGQAMNRLLDRTALAAMADVDIVLWLVQAGQWHPADERLQQRLLSRRPRALGVVLSQVDRIADKQRLLPELGRLQQSVTPDFLVPLSAQRRDNLQALEAEIAARLPVGEWAYDAQTLTPHRGEFLIAEHIREQLFRRLHQEIPYALTVTVDEVEERAADLSARATIWISRPAHKRMIIGKGGQTLKQVGSLARQRLAQLFGKPVHLTLWVKLREGWADNEEGLRSFGIGSLE